MSSPRSRRSPPNSWSECWKTRISSRCTGVSGTRPPPADRRASPFNFASFRKLAAGQGAGGPRRVETSATAPVQMGYRRVNDLRTGRGEDRFGGPELSAVRMIFSKRAARLAIRELCNRAAETIKLDPAADRCGRRRGLKWYRVSFSTVPPMLAPPRSQGAYALSSAKTVCRRICR